MSTTALAHQSANKRLDGLTYKTFNASALTIICATLFVRYLVPRYLSMINETTGRQAFYAR